MTKACVIGWPISHSRSPIIHNYWLRLHHIQGSYQRIPVEPSRLAEFIRSLPEAGYAGCNVTLPHKEAVFDLVTPADDMTRRLGVVNTVFLRDGSLLGTSTDGEGFIASLRAGAPLVALANQKIVMLGAGGAAMAVVGALLSEGVAEIAVANRTPERTLALRRKFGDRIHLVDWEDKAHVLDGAALLVNTTSLGMTGQPALDIKLDRLPDSAVVTDIIYAPLQTPLLEQAEARGLRAVGGLGMLLHQAVRGFELWFGIRPAVTDELHDLVARDVDPGYHR